MLQKLSEIFSELGELENRRGRVFPSRVFYKASKLVKNADSYEIISDRVHLHFNFTGCIVLGPSCSEIFIEFLNTSNCKRLVELRKEFKIKKINNTFLDELQRISGIGEVKARLIVESGKYKDLNDLLDHLPEVDEFICDGVRFTSMMATGVKILRLTSGNRLPWDEANKLANDIIYSVNRKTNVSFYTYKLGSLRRQRATVGDIDLMISDCTESDFPELRELFAKELDSLLVQGETKIAGIKKGFQVDIRFISKQYLGAHLLHGTGSQKFNILMRAHARSLGCKLNEYGIYDQFGRFHCFETEREVFKFLKVKYVDPRDRDEVEYLVKE